MPKLKSKYSPSDVNRFSNIPADATIVTPDGVADPCLGDGKIGKVEVQCRFLHEESKWGRLENKDGTAVSAGIIHMEILFKNLHECALESAVIRVVLDGEHQLLQSYRKILGQEEKGEKGDFKKNKNAVEVREVGPRSIAGTPFGVVRKSVFSVNPAVEFEGLSFSAIEASKEQEWTQITRWVFEGGAWAHKSSRSDTVNSVEWSLSENIPERQPSHGNRFRTAFVFANDGRPFILKVEVGGFLSKFRDRAKEKLKRGLKFGSSSSKISPTTLIRGFEKETQRLNKLAARLNEDMNKLNGAVDYNRRADGQAHDPGPVDKAGLRHDEEDGEGDRIGVKEPMDFVGMATFVAESGKEYGRDKGQGSTSNLKPASGGIQATQPQTKLVQGEEARALPHLLFQIWRQLLGRIQQLLMLG